MYWNYDSYLGFDNNHLNQSQLLVQWCASQVMNLIPDEDIKDFGHYTNLIAIVFQATISSLKVEHQERYLVQFIF